jgi:hypothetical protein
MQNTVVSDRGRRLLFRASTIETLAAANATLNRVTFSRIDVDVARVGVDVVALAGLQSAFMSNSTLRHGAAEAYSLQLTLRADALDAALANTTALGATTAVLQASAGLLLSRCGPSRCPDWRCVRRWHPHVSQLLMSRVLLQSAAQHPVPGSQTADHPGPQREHPQCCRRCQ